MWPFTRLCLQINIIGSHIDFPGCGRGGIVRMPCMGQVRAQQDQIIVTVRTDMIPDITLSLASKRQGQFVFRMKMPLERDRTQVPVQAAP